MTIDDRPKHDSNSVQWLIFCTNPSTLPACIDLDTGLMMFDRSLVSLGGFDLDILKITHNLSHKPAHTDLWEYSIDY
jgi:hypothetical protein